MLVKLIGILTLCHLIKAQNPSPCREIFSYEPRSQEQDRWYGVISLQTKDDLDGVWVKVVLDRPAELLGNWFGEAESSDNQEFTIKNAKYKLEAGPPVSLRFFVKYNAASVIPSVTSIKLNGKTICPEDSMTTPKPIFISSVRNTSRPSGSNNRPSGSNNRPSVSNSRPSVSNNNNNNNRPSVSNSRPSVSNNRPSSVEEDNYSPSNEANSNEERPSYRPVTNSGGSSNRRPDNNNNNYVNQQSNNKKPSYQDTVRSIVLPTLTNLISNNPQLMRLSQLNTSLIHDRIPILSVSTSRPNNNSDDGTPATNIEGSSTNNTDRETDSDSTSNHLSAKNENGANGNDYFPGDFAIHHPTQLRPQSRPSSNNKRSVKCGTVAMKPSPLISFGQNTTQGEWPWHAALYYAQGAQLMYTCGATLISENHILTAAHCVAKPQSKRPIDIKRLSVYLGKYSLKKFGPEIQDREVAEINIHPQYNYSVYFNDIAILKLKDPIEITNYVRPCCLWEDDTDVSRVINKLGTVVGWGFDEERQISDTLMQAQMPVVDLSTCIFSNREFFSHFTFEKTYCAGFRNGTTVCNGDSGGGMVFPKSGTSGQNTVWQIRGIVSVGVALQGQGVCDPKHYIVFTDVAKHLDWIRQVMNE